MASTKRLIKPESGYGIIGVNVFFSVADIYRLKEIITSIQATCVAGEVAIRDLMYLHDKLVAAITSNEDSVFASAKADEIDDDIK